MKKEQAKEWMILISLFKATVEQMSMLIGVEKHRTKWLFNQWMKIGNQLLKRFEGVFNEEILEAYVERIENETTKLRKEIDVID